MVKDYYKYQKKHEESIKSFEEGYNYAKEKHGDDYTEDDYKLWYGQERPVLLSLPKFLIDKDSCWESLRTTNVDFLYETKPIGEEIDERFFNVIRDENWVGVLYPTESVKEALKLQYEIEVRKRTPWAEVVFSQNLEENIEAVAKWITSTERRQGLMLCGLCGNGKTTLLKAIAHLFDVYSCGTRNIEVEKSENIKSFTPKNIYLIDDVGREPKTVRKFGNEETPMRDFLLQCYDTMQPIIITTNFDYNCFEDWYEPRTADRCKEMFLRLVFKDQSYRK